MNDCYFFPKDKILLTEKEVHKALIQAIKSKRKKRNWFNYTCDLIDEHGIRIRHFYPDYNLFKYQDTYYHCDRYGEVTCIGNTETTLNYLLHKKGDYENDKFE